MGQSEHDPVFKSRRPWNAGRKPGAAGFADAAASERLECEGMFGLDEGGPAQRCVVGPASRVPILRFDFLLRRTGGHKCRRRTCISFANVQP